MQFTGTLHPPGGATALIAVICGKNIHQFGYIYALFPGTTGALIMLIIALEINKLGIGRKYPTK